MHRLVQIGERADQDIRNRRDRGEGRWRGGISFVAYEPFVNRILGLFFAWNPSSLSVEIFLKDLIRKYGCHPVWTDGADWYPLTCEPMNLKHPHLSARKMAMEGHGTSDGEAERQDGIFRRSLPLQEPWSEVQVEAHIQLAQSLLAAQPAEVSDFHQKNQEGDAKLTGDGNCLGSHKYIVKLISNLRPVRL